MCTRMNRVDDPRFARTVRRQGRTRYVVTQVFGDRVFYASTGKEDTGFVNEVGGAKLHASSRGADLALERMVKGGKGPRSTFRIDAVRDGKILG